MRTPTRHRPLTAIATIALIALPLAACDRAGSTDPTTSASSTSASPTTSTTTSSSADAAQETPQQRIEGYMAAADEAAANGWKDTSYNAKYLTPELAQKSDEGDAKNKATGAIITGPRQLSDWTTVDESDTQAVIEFCNDTSAQTATRDGQPIDFDNQGGDHKSVARFTLVRAGADQPWLISEKGFYPEDTTCADHFAQG